MILCSHLANVYGQTLILDTRLHDLSLYVLVVGLGETNKGIEYSTEGSGLDHTHDV